MARSVVAGHPLTSGAPWEWIRGLPLLSPVALPIYSTVLGDRLEKFPQPQENQKWHLVTTTKEKDKESLRSLPWSHELRHDGESVFWLLVWWAIHLRPKSSSSSKIRSTIFGSLTNIDLEVGDDPRISFMQALANRISWLDPEYQGLEPLFLQMAEQLTGDLYWAEDSNIEEMKDPEFLHEALQRIIFNFIMENKMQSFMRLEKDPLHDREIEEQIRQHADRQFTRPSKRSHSIMAGQSESEGSRVGHLSSPFLCTPLTLVGAEAH